MNKIKLCALLLAIVATTALTLVIPKATLFDDCTDPFCVMTS
jgi:hypothetical protein